MSSVLEIPSIPAGAQGFPFPEVVGFDAEEAGIGVMEAWDLPNCPQTDDIFCDVVIHEATLDLWLVISSTACDNLRDSYFIDYYQAEVNSLAAAPPLLGQIFPAWLLELTGADAEAPAVFDQWSWACEVSIDSGPFNIVPFIWPRKPKHPIPNPCPCVVNYVKV